MQGRTEDGDLLTVARHLLERPPAPRGQRAIEKGGVDPSGQKIPITENPQQSRNRGPEAAHGVLAEGADHPSNRVLPIFSPRDHL